MTGPEQSQDADVVEGVVTMAPTFLLENATPLEDLFTIDFNVKGDDGDEYWCASHIRFEGVAAPPEDLSEGDRVRVTGVSFGGCGTPGEPVEFHAKNVEQIG